MSVLMQILLIFSLYFLGEAISYFLPIKIPASVLGMAIFAFLLFRGYVKEKHIKEKTDFLFRYMPLIFLPPAVNLLQYLDFLKEQWWRLAIVLICSSLITFFVTAWTVQIIVKLQSKYRRGK